MSARKTIPVFLGFGIVAVVLLGSALPASAQTIYYPQNQNMSNWYLWSYGYYVTGYEFRVDFPSVTVTRLGCYTQSAGSRTVSLWTAGGSLLASANVTSGSTWTFANLATPVVLTQGNQYVVTEWGLTGYDYYSYNSGFTGDGRVTWITGRYYYSSVNAFPLYSYNFYNFAADIGYTIMPPPPTPATITVPASSFSGNYTVSWSSASTATYYELEEDTNPSFVAPVQLYSGPNLSFNVTGRLNGTYYYRVRAGNLGGPSGWRTGSNPCLVTLLPGAVGSLTVPPSSSTGNFFVQWTAVQWATYYELEECTATSAPWTWTPVFSGASMSWSAVGKPDGSYRYRVRARNAAGPSPTWTHGSWPTVPPAPAEPGDPCVVMKPPFAPASLTVPFNSTNGVYMVSWTASPSGTVTYRLQEDTDASFGSPTQIYLGTSTSFTAGGGPTPNDPRQNGTYYYRVRAENLGGPSGWTIGGNGCTVLLPPPASPGSLTVPLNSATGNYPVTWGASPSALSYQLQEATDGSFAGAMTVYSGAGTTHNVAGNPGSPPLGTTYYYRVRAWNSSGWSNWTVGGNGCLVMIPVPGDSGWIRTEDPQGTAATSDADGSYWVAWGAASGAATYVVEEATNAGFMGPATVYTGSAQFVQITGRGNGTYYYRVKGQNTSGQSPNWAWTGTGMTVLVPPASPGSLSVPLTSSTGNYTVVWTSSVTATDYELQESMNGGAWATAYGPGPNLSLNVTGKGDGTYTYQVRARNASGWSGWTAGSNACVVLFPPGAPGSITVPLTSDTGTYTVSWGAVGTATRYELEESGDNKVTWTLVYGGPLTQHQVTGKVSGTYWYQVRSWNASGYCALPTVSGNGCTIVAPTTPTGLTCPGTSATGTWTVSWNASLGATGYVLEEYGTAWGVVYTGPNTSFVVSGKTTGTFQYRVSAVNGAGTSAASGAVSCTMVSPLAPGSVNVPATSISGYYQVSWSVSAGATRYVLQESTSPAFGTVTQLMDGAATSFYVTGKQNGTYYYRVEAHNAVGGSGWTAGGNGCVVSLSAPNPVASITVPGTSVTGSYTVVWTTSFGATGYELQEATQSNFSDAHTVYTGSGATTFVSGRSNGTYYYRVRATNPVGASGWTPGGNGCVVNLLPPGAPGNFTVPFSSFSGTYAVTWTTGTGAMWYVVEEDTDAGFGAPRTVYVGGALQTWMLGRGNGTYYYRIRSVNPIGQSGWVRGGNGCSVAVVSPALGVFGGPANPMGTREVPGATGVPMLHLQLATGAGGAVRIESLTVRGTGTGNEASGVDAVKLWEDVDGDGVLSVGDRALGTAQAYVVDEGTVTFGGLSETIGASSVRLWLVTYDFDAGAMAGEDYRAEWSSNGDMTAKDAAWGSGITPQGAPVQGGVKTLSVFGTGDLSVYLGSKSPGGLTVLPGTLGVGMVQWNLVSSSVEEVRVSRVTVWAIGDGNDAADVSGVRLVLDANGNGLADAGETVLGTGTYGADNGSLSFALSPELSVPAGSSRKLVAVYDFGSGIAGTWKYGAGLLTTGDLSTAGATSGSPVSLQGPPVLGTYTTVSTPPVPAQKAEPEYSMGGCAGGSGALGAAGLAGFAAPWAALAACLFLARRRRNA